MASLAIAFRPRQRHTHRDMAGLTVPATEQFTAPGAGSGDIAKMYASSLNSFGEDLEEIMSVPEADVELEPLIAGTVSPPAVTKAARRKGWMQFAALCMALYLAGWSDATVGPLVPRIQQVYHVSDEI